MYYREVVQYNQMDDIIIFYLLMHQSRAILHRQ